MTTRQVQLWYVAGPENKLVWMYAPVVDSLRLGFAPVAKVSVGLIGGRLGVSTRSQAFLDRLETLKRGDAFIYIGIKPGHIKIPWYQLRSRGALTVFYETEPNALACSHKMPLSARADELWSYSHRVLEMCQSTYSVRRYVPPGHSSSTIARPPGRAPYAKEWDGTSGEWVASKRVDRSVLAVEGAATSGDLPKRGGGTELLFLGYPFFKSRQPCYDKLQVALGQRVNATWSVTSAAAFEAWWAEQGSHVVHLNLHKRGTSRTRLPGRSSVSVCSDAPTQAFEAFRAALLLSRGGLLISQRSDERDEAEFEGLVHFAAVDDMAALLPKLLQRVRTRAQLRIAASYRERFEPRRLFARAGIYERLLNGTVSGVHSAERTAVAPASRGTRPRARHRPMI